MTTLFIYWLASGIATHMLLTSNGFEPSAPWVFFFSCLLFGGIAIPVMLAAVVFQ